MAIVLNSKTYNFIGFDRNGVSVYKETSSGTPTGYSYLTCAVIEGANKQPIKVRWRLTMPVVATVDSSCGCVGSVLRTFYFDEGRVEIPRSSIQAERDDFQARITALTNTTEYKNSVKSLVQPSA